MIYITGDIHGSRRRVETYIESLLKPDDSLLVTGDFGIGFFRDENWSEESEDGFFDYLEKQNCTFIFCDGNHEDFNKLNNYTVSNWNGGRVHKIRKNVIHLMRGEVYDIDGKKAFVMGGGYSLDKGRRTCGYTWWPEEMPNNKEYENASKNLKANNYKVDYILTHTAPRKTIVYMSTLGENIKPMVREELPLNEFLQWVEETTEYDKWYLGHFHLDREMRGNQYVLFNEIRELHSGRLVSRNEV